MFNINKKFLKINSLVLIGIICLSCFLFFQNKGSKNANSKELVVFTDDLGRKVKIPKKIKKVSCSGLVSQTVLYPLAKDKLISVSNKKFFTSNKKFFDKKFLKLKETGSIFQHGKKLNSEKIMRIKPDIIIDIGDSDKNMAKELDKISRKIKIPIINLKGNINSYKRLYKILGKILNEEKKAKKLADFADEAYKISKKIPENKKKNVLLIRSMSNKALVTKGSLFSEVVDLICNNVCETNMFSKNNFVQFNLEQIVKYNPEVIFFLNEEDYNSVLKNKKIFKNKKCYKVPSLCYNFLSFPPSINRLAGLYWSMDLLYKDELNKLGIDAKKKIKEFYKLFLDYELSDKEYKEIINN